MKESSELAQALSVIIKSAGVESTNEVRRDGYATPPIVGYGEDAAAAGEVHLRDYWRVIRKRLWLIVGLAAIVASISTIRQAREPDVYQARARVEVDTETFSPALGASKGGSIYIDSYVDPEYFNTQVQILSSPTLLRRVVRNLDLERNRNFLNPRTENQSTWQSVLRMLGYGPKAKESAKTDPQAIPTSSGTAATTATASLDDPEQVERLAPYVGSLQGMLEVEHLKRTRLIDIRASHSDPGVATRVVNATADAFALWNLEIKTKTNSIAGAYLQKRIAELQSQIRSGEEQLINYAQSHSILSLDGNQNTVVERLAGLNRQLLEAENDRELAEATLRASFAPGAAEAQAETGDRQIVEFKTRLAELKQKRAQLMVTDTEQSPEVRDVNEQMAALEKQLGESRSSARTAILTNLETNYRKAVEREKALRESFNKQRGETVTQNQSAINYNILKQEIETNKGLLEGLMQRSKENDVTMAGTPNNIYVVDYAAVPKGPIGPRRLQSVLLALFVAIAFGVALTLFLDYLDDTIKSPGDVESSLRLPALVSIPLAGTKATQRLWRLRSALLLGNGHRKGAGSELLINANGPSPQAEAYRHLRTSVLLSTPGRAPKTLLVTSSVPAEGKTTTVVNVATVLAQTGAKVLVIDADMRRPRLHQVFGMDADQGLSSILSSDVSEVEILAMINQYQDSNVYLLGSGTIPPNPAELLGAEQMRRLLEVAGATFNYVVIDSPPIASFTDGMLISSMVDGVLLVVHGGKTSRQVARRTRQMLHEIGAKIIGVVLNKVDMRSHSYYYYRHNYEGYYYSGYYESGANGDRAAAKSLSVVPK
jgi:polysaccharide biosynthesis transport protein